MKTFTKTYEELLEMHEVEISCLINRVFIGDSQIIVKNGNIYIAQDIVEKDGSNIKGIQKNPDTLGYNYLIPVFENGKETQTLEVNKVIKGQLIPKKIKTLTNELNFIHTQSVLKTTKLVALTIQHEKNKGK